MQIFEGLALSLGREPDMVVFALEAGEAPADLQEFPLEDLHWRSVAAQLVNTH